MFIQEWNGQRLKVMEVIHDETYGTVWDAYLNHRKVYIVNGKVVEDQKIIDDLDNKYGIPVSMRGILF